MWMSLTRMRNEEHDEEINEEIDEDNEEMDAKKLN